MATDWHFERPAIPVRAVVISVLALAVPVAAALVPEGATSGYALLLWLVALIPAFLLSYYRGWVGVAVAQAAGMAALSTTQVVVLLAGRTVRDWPLLAEVVAGYVVLSLAIGWLSDALHRSRAQAEVLALTDDLTALPNRRHARMFLEENFEEAQSGDPLTIVLFDIDSFKEFNDEHGHLAGDEALKLFARVLGRSTRPLDLSARYGGEEFLSVLPACGTETALGFVEEVRAGLEHSQPAEARFTVSAGVATYNGGMSYGQFLRAADHALYDAKREGRDLVRVYTLEADDAAGQDPRASAPSPAVDVLL